MVIRDAESLSRLFAEILGPTVMVALAPVDFERHMIVGVLLGERPTAGFRVDISGVQQAADAIIVQAAETAPGPDDIVAQVLTFPFQLVTIPRSDLEARFQISLAPQ